MKLMYSPSLMCVELLEAKKDIIEIERAGTDFFHIDIMDGEFVPNLTLNIDFIKAVRKISDVPLDVHLMVNRPENYIEALRDAGVEYVTFHPETVHFPIRLIEKIKSNGMKAGVALSPRILTSELTYYLEYIDMVLVMAVEPGFAGQSFIESVYEKIVQVREMIDSKELDIILSVDGNINKATAVKSAKKGADCFVLGTSSIFKQEKGLYESFCSFKQSVGEEVIL